MNLSFDHPNPDLWRRPAALHRGDVIGIISPAGPVTPEGLQPGLARLRAEGFELRLGRHLYANTGYLAGADSARLEDLHGMFADPDVKAVFCSRGGYGCMRLLGDIDYDRLAANPKIFMGFSDITALLLAMGRRAGFSTCHGPVVKQMADLDDRDYSAMLSLLGGTRPTTVHFGKGQLRRPGQAAGPLIGGNLTLLAHLLGTPFMPDFKGAILFLEDQGEQPYRVDRLLTHLALAGAFDGIAGLIGGEFIDCGPESTVWGLLLELADKLDVPLATALPVGHGNRNITLPLGVEAVLDTHLGTLQFN